METLNPASPASAVYLTSVQSVTVYFTNTATVFHQHLEKERIKSIHVGANKEEYLVLTTYTDGDVMHGYFSKHSVQRVQYTVKK